MSWDATIFTGLEKHTNNNKEDRKRMDAMCLIKTADPQQFYHLWNELENGAILGDSTDMHPNTIAKAYGVLCKYKSP